MFVCGLCVCLCVCLCVDCVRVCVCVCVCVRVYVCVICVDCLSVSRSMMPCLWIMPSPSKTWCLLVGVTGGLGPMRRNTPRKSAGSAPATTRASSAWCSSSTGSHAPTRYRLRALYAAAPIFWSSSLSSQSTACTRSTSSRPSRPDRQRLALGRSPFSPSLFSLLTSGGGAADALAPGPRERADAGAWRSFTGTGYVHARRGRGGAPAKAWHASAHISTSTRHGATEGGRTLTVPTHEPNYSGQTSPDRLLKRRKASFSISDTN